MRKKRAVTASFREIYQYNALIHIRAWQFMYGHPWIGAGSIFAVPFLTYSIMAVYYKAVGQTATQMNTQMIPFSIAVFMAVAIYCVGLLVAPASERAHDIRRFEKLRLRAKVRQDRIIKHRQAGLSKRELLAKHEGLCRSIELIEMAKGFFDEGMLDGEERLSKSIDRVRVVMLRQTDPEWAERFGNDKFEFGKDIPNRKQHILAFADMKLGRLRELKERLEMILSL